MRKLKKKDNYNPENVYQDDFQKYIGAAAKERFRAEHEHEPWIDVEAEYKKQEQFLREVELERFLKTHKLNGLYRTRTTKAGNQLEVDIYPSFYLQKDVPVEKKGTSPAQKKLNSEKARRYYIALVNENFGKGDYWCTWTYTNANLPQSMEEAEKNMVKFVNRIKYRIKKLGLPDFKYTYVTEWSREKDPKTGKEKVRCHHHMTCSGDIDRDLLESLWKLGDRNQTRNIAPDDDAHLTGMATYMSKDPKGKKRWKSSKNLRKPKVTKSYSKFNKKEVNRMVRNENAIKELMEKKYPGYVFLTAQVRFNSHNQGNYIYAKMVKYQTAEPTKKQKQIILSHGYDPGEYAVIRAYEERMKIIHKETNEIVEIYHGAKNERKRA